MPLRIRINNQNKRRRIERKAVARAARMVFRAFEKKKNAIVGITFLSDPGIRALNKRYMKKDKPTDVLSFLLEEKSNPRAACLIGDVYISSDTASRNAGRFGTHFREEIILYTIHGMLHLLGFGDKSAAEKKKIRGLESRFLKEFFKK